jgi:hypothetical protein
MLRRDWEVCLFFVISILLLFSLQLIGNTPEKHSQYPLIRVLIDVLNVLRQKIVPISAPLASLAAVCYLLLPLSIGQRRAVIDVTASWCIIRILDLFVLINLLIFLRTSDHALLVAQLLIFMPCLLLIWGWIYWRMDTRHKITAGKRMFVFKIPEGTSPTVYDYFLVSFTSLISNTLSGFSGETRTARTLIFIHGIMMWDVMGLILSRAIASASS